VAGPLMGSALTREELPGTGGRGAAGRDGRGCSSRCAERERPVLMAEEEVVDVGGGAGYGEAVRKERG
jgi:hypothetical protein